MPEGLRILVWCPEINPGGGARLLASLVPALARQPGVSLVRFARPSPPAGAPDPLPPGNLDGSGVETIRVGGNPGLLPGRRMFGLPGTGRLIHAWRRRRFRRELRDLAAGMSVVYAPWPHRVPWEDPGRPLVCTFQDATLIEFPEILGGPASRAERASAADWLRSSAQVIVSSRAMAAALARLFPGIGRAPVLIPHCTVPLPASRGPAKAMPPPSVPARYLLCPATLTAHKNHETLFQAWSRFSRRNAIPLVLCGGGTDRLGGGAGAGAAADPACRLSGLIGRLGLRPGTDFHALGYVSDETVHALIAGAEALVMPTLAEGGGSYPVEEALAAGVPVACSDLPVLREQLEGRSARVAWFDPQSPDSICRALESLFDAYEDYRESARRAASDPRPTWDAIAARYVETLRAAAGGSASGGTVEIELIGPEHEEALVRFFADNNLPDIVRQFHPFPLTPDTARRIAREPRRDRVYGAFRDGRLVAIALLRGWDEGFDVPSLGLLVDRRAARQGIGRRLAARALAEARAAGARRVRLSVCASNTAALRLYGGLGFRETGRVPARIGTEADEKIEMHLDLASPTEAP